MPFHWQFPRIIAASCAGSRWLLCLREKEGGRPGIWERERACPQIRHRCKSWRQSASTSTLPVFLRASRMGCTSWYTCSNCIVQTGRWRYEGVSTAQRGVHVYRHQWLCFQHQTFWGHFDPINIIARSKHKKLSGDFISKSNKYVRDALILQSWLCLYVFIYFCMIKLNKSWGKLANSSATKECFTGQLTFFERRF